MYDNYMNAMMKGCYRNCMICGKRFYVPSADYVYKDTAYYGNRKTAMVYFCRYNHMREYERMVEPRAKAQERIRELRPKLSIIKHNQPNLKVDGKTAKRVEADIKAVEKEIKQQLDLIKKIDKAVQDAIKRNKALKEDTV